PEGKLEEAMTVHLTDESKTVGGKEPNNERYTFIKDSLFEQIDREDYESWQDKVFRHFDKLNKDKINEHLESIDEDMLYNIDYIRKAPKSTEHHDLSDIIKIAYFEKNKSEELIIVIDIDKNLIHIKLWFVYTGILSTNEKGVITNLDKVTNHLEKYNILN